MCDKTGRGILFTCVHCNTPFTHLNPLQPPSHPHEIARQRWRKLSTFSDLTPTHLPACSWWGNWFLQTADTCWECSLLSLHTAQRAHHRHKHSTTEKAVNLQLVPLQTANTCRDYCILQTVGTLQTRIESAAHCSLHCRQMPRLLHSAHHSDRESCGFIPRFVLELQQQIENFICHP